MSETSSSPLPLFASTYKNRTSVPTTAWERYLWRSNGDDDAMTFRSIVELEGSLDESALAASMSLAAANHPLLNARVMENVRGGDGPPAWGIDSPADHTVGRARAPLTRFDLTKQSGFAVGVLSLPSNVSRAVFDFHHACVDGQGAGRVVADGLRRLSGRRSPRSDSFGGLAERDVYPPPVDQPTVGTIENFRNLWSTIRGRTWRNPVRQIPHDVDSQIQVDPAVETDLICVGTLSSAQSIPTREALLSAKVLDNDAGLAATFAALVRTIGLSLGTKSMNRHRITVMNPVDLRTFSDRNRTACNRTGLAFLRRRIKDVAGKELLTGLVSEMNYIRNRQVAVEFLRGLELIERSPKATRFIERRQWFDPTASLTCVTNFQPGTRWGMRRDSDGWYLGDCRFRGYSAVPPRQPGCPLAIALVRSGDSLRVTLRGDRRCWNVPDLELLATTWFDSLLDLVETRGQNSLIGQRRAEVEIETWK